MSELLDVVAPKGAQLLVEGIRDGLFVPPIQGAVLQSERSHGSLTHAAKIRPEDRHINWQNWSLLDIRRRDRVLGALWSKALVPTNPADEPPSFSHKRVIFTDIEEVEPPNGCDAFSIVPGLPFADAPYPVEAKKGRALYVFSCDGKLFRINKMKVEGEPSADGLRAAIKARMFSDRSIQAGGAEFTPFRNPFV